MAKLFSNVADGIVYGGVITDDDGKPVDLLYLDMNDAYERLLPLKREEVLGKRLTDVFPTFVSDGTILLSPYAEAALEGRSSRYERLWPVTNRWYDVMVFSPAKPFFIAIVKDIDPRKRAEEASKESEARYKLLQDYAPSAIFEVDFRDYRFKSVNDAMTLLCGYSREELMRMSAMELLDDRGKEKLKERARRLLAGEVIEDKVDYAVMRKDGQMRAALLNTKTLYNDGKPCGTFVIATDITERKKIERALQESEAKYRGLFENLQESVSFFEYVLDDGGEVVDWRYLDINRSTEKGIGLPRQDIIGKTVMQLFGNEAIEKFVPLIRQMRIDNQPKTLESFFEPTGTYGLNFFAPLSDDRFIISTMNVTEIKNAQNLIEEYSRNLERSNAELQQFAYVASHDLREPLRMVSSYLDLLEERYNGKILDERGREYFKYAVEGAHRMQQMINDLLAYSRIDTQGKSFTTVDMEEVLATSLNDMKVIVEGTNASITNDPLPCVVADKIQMIKVFENLIGNALKFHGPEAPRIHIAVEGDGREWIFSVKDNGIGMDLNKQVRLFDMFQRLHTSEDYSGNGIGLAVTKKIIERHDGRIWAESELGKGSTFFFSIPVGRRVKGND